MAADRLWAYALKGNLPQSTRLYNLQVEDVENPVAHQLEIYFCRLVCESGLSNLDYHPV